MKFKPIITDKSGQEITEFAHGQFELSMDWQQVSDPLCHSIPHWHPEIQISVVMQGCVKFRILDSVCTLRPGEGIFLNSGCRHEILLDEETADGVYLCANFSPSVITGRREGIQYRSYVEPVITSPNLYYMELKDQPWQTEILGLVASMGKIEQDQAFGYELKMMQALLQIWHLLLVNSRDKFEPGSSVSFSDRSQIYLMQKFIQKHYMEDISLEDIAESAHISVGECCRVFKRSLNTSPIQYLINHRINQSLKLLTGSDLSVGVISQQVGYSSSSHFSSSFKKNMNVTPLQYRMRQVNQPIKEGFE